LISFSDAQMTQIMTAAALVPVADRNNFLRSVAGVLDGNVAPSDADVGNALTMILNMRDVATNGFKQRGATPDSNKRRKYLETTFAQARQS
jgi:hypothetical protein